MKGMLSFLVIIVIYSCTDDKWKTFPENKFIGNNIIDTTKYHSLEEIFKEKKIYRPSFEAYSYYHFTSPLVTDNKYVFIEKKHLTDKDKNVILKLDKKGDIIDSIVINKFSSIINNYILEKDYYISWFIDSDKTKKALPNENYFSKSDTLKIKNLVKELKRNKIKFYSSEYSDSNNSIDTCNYIITFQNNKLIKYNYTNSYDLKINNENPDDFSEKYRNIQSLNSEKLFKVDNFFANASERLIRKGNKIHSGDLFSNTGQGHVTPCNTFIGTYFFTLLNLKLKIPNQRICQERILQESANKPSIYSSEFLDFYLIELPLDTDEPPYYYYILKK